MLQSLPEGQRQVMAFMVDSFTPVEISALVGRSPDAIRQPLYAARQRLKTMLRREQIDEHMSPQGRGSAGNETR
jgi:DNA-directed RNA polymerase specialized sigma24 family protein